MMMMGGWRGKGRRDDQWMMMEGWMEGLREG